MHVTVSSFVWWEDRGTYQVLVVNCLNVINCTEKWVLALIPALLLSQLVQDRHTEKSMFSYSDCIKNTDMQGWGKAHRQLLIAVPYALKRVSRPGWKEVNILLLLVLLGEHHCSAWLEIFLSSTHFCLVLCYFVYEMVPFSVKVIKSLLRD